MFHSFVYKQSRMKWLNKINWFNLARIGSLLLVMCFLTTNILIYNELTIQKIQIETFIEELEEQKKLVSINGKQNNSMLLEIVLMSADIDLIKEKLYDE